MYIDLHAKYPLFLSGFYETRISRQIKKITQILNFMKTRPIGAEFFHADGQT